MPTPAQVPVAMMSPGSSVMTRDRVSMSVGMSKMSWETSASWRTSPFTRVTRCIVPGSFTSSAVSRHGPIGQ
ncbi:hypothetical protein D3C83_109680 [compost metagenome]